MSNVEPRFGRLITAMVTPFNDERELDLDRAQALATRLIEGGNDSLIINGTTGESPTVFYPQKIELFRAVVEAVGGKAPVIANVGDNCTADTVDFAKDVAKLGVDGFMCVVPYYNKPPQEGMYQHFKTIADAVELPIILYNIPGNTGTNIPREVLAELAEIDNVRGIKDSSGDLENLKGYLEAAEGKGVDVLVGSDSKILAGLELGATGAIAGTSNLITEQVVGLYDAFKAGDRERAAELQADIEPLRDVIHLGAQPSMVKRALELVGVPVGPCRLPILDATPEQDERVRAMLDHYGIAHE